MVKRGRRRGSIARLTGQALRAPLRRFPLLPRTLLARTFLLLAGLLTASVLAWSGIYAWLERAPRAQQAAQIIISVINLTRASLVSADPQRRVELLTDLSMREGLRIYLDGDIPGFDPIPGDRSLAAIEDELAGALQAGGAAIYAGRCTTSGSRDFYFYTDAPSACADRAAGVMADHAAYQYALGHRPDPAWTVYFDFLYPGPQDLQRIFNRRVVALLQENGDEISQPRWIDHRAYLPGRAAAETLLADLSAQGFSIVTAPEDSAERIAVDFKRIDQPDAIDAVVLPLVAIITSLGGSYDGWGCEVETGRG